MNFEICYISFSIVLLFVCNVVSHPPIHKNQDIVKKCMDEIGCSGKQINRLKDLKVGELQAKINSRFKEYGLAMNHQLDTLRREIKIQNETLRREIKTQNETLRREIKIQNETLRGEIKTQNETLRREIKIQNETLRREIKIQNETLHKDIALLREKLSNVRRERLKERKERLKLEAQFDFVELIKRLVEDCYPKWAKPRLDNDFSPAVWHTVLLNIESVRVIQIRLQMKQDNVTEEEFISAIDDIMLGRHQKAHHALTDAERAEAYPEWLAVTTSSHKTVIAALLRFSYKVEEEKVIPFEYRPSTTSTISPKDLELISDVIREAKQNRSHLNLLMAAGKPFLSSKSEKDLEKEVENFNIRVCYKSPDNNAYLLFNDFDHAYAAMQHLEKNGAKGEFRIKSVNDYELHPNSTSIDGDPNLQQNSILKVEQEKQLRKSSQIAQTTDELSYKLQGIIQSNFIKGVRVEILALTNTVLLKGETLEHTLMVYQLLKENLNSGELLSIVSEKSVNMWKTGSTKTIYVS